MYVGMDTFHSVLSSPAEECEACEEQVFTAFCSALMVTENAAKIFSMHSAIPD